jgi:integrase
MASVKPYPYKKGWWRAQIARRGVRKSATFPSKGAANAWISREEGEIMAGVRGEIPPLLTVKDLLKRYRETVSIAKKGKRWEAIRLEAIERDSFARVRLRALDTPHTSDWQERRLKAVSGASVRRERNLLNHAFQIAINEWRWLRKNPFAGIRRPKDGKPRSRIATADELGKLAEAASPALGRTITFAIETGMRASEIAELRDVRGRVAYLTDSKSGRGREVPLSAKALEAWQGGIGLTAGSISALFARLCKDIDIKGLTFHDLRHTAATRISKRLDAWELCKMFGWKDPKIALNIYYKADTEEMAAKL